VGTLICAFDTKGDVVAGIKVYTFKDEQSGVRTGITDSIFTLPDWRGKGIGKNLINEALRFLQENGIKQSCLEVSSLNEKAFNLYTRMGYKVVGEKIIMTKSL
jgi:ribosomal protein S18 acetylase RimI-like enzyme